MGPILLRLLTLNFTHILVQRVQYLTREWLKVIAWAKSTAAATIMGKIRDVKRKVEAKVI